MISFCLTNEPSLVNSDWQHKLHLHDGVWFYYNNGKRYHGEILDLPKHRVVFCGVLWQGKVTDFVDNVKQNGIFYAIVINKESGEIKFINDFSDSFFINYHMSGKHFVVTNEIKVYSSDFTVDSSWVYRAKRGDNLWNAPPEPHDDLAVPAGNRINENATPLKGVQYLGPGKVLNLTKSTIETYFSYNDDICTLFSEKPRHDYKSALDTAKRIIRENCKHIKKKFGTQLVHFCSTGVDSLVVQSHLNDVPTYGFYNENFDRYHESTKLFKQLYRENNGTLHRLTTSSIPKIMNQHMNKLQKTINYKPAHLIFMDMIDRYKLNDRVIIQGHGGNLTFYHNRYYVLRHAVHRWKFKNAEQIWDKCLPHYGFGGPAGPAGFYSKEARIDEMNEYISNPCKDFATAIMQVRYCKRLYGDLTGQYVPNQLMIDPYADLRLLELLPSSNRVTQRASILNATLQKEMISDRFKPYLNPYIAGTNWLWDRDFNNGSFRRKAIDAILKNLQAKHNFSKQRKGEMKQL